MRWLYHIARRQDLHRDRAAGSYAPSSLASEGFVHASFAPAVAESARLYFGPDDELVVLRIDPRRVGAVVREEPTPRGPMPHVFGPIPREAIAAEHAVTDMTLAPDRMQTTRVAFVAFAGMTLLDLVGVLDPVSRLSTMGVDTGVTCEVVSATLGDEVFASFGLTVSVASHRPALSAYDLVVVAGGPAARELAREAEIVAWLRERGPHALVASVCTGALLLGAAGRLSGLRATTHESARDELAQYGATYEDARVVDAGHVVTAAGVTAGIDLGLHLVARLAGDDARAKIARQMNVPA